MKWFDHAVLAAGVGLSLLFWNWRPFTLACVCVAGVLFTDWAEQRLRVKPPKRITRGW